MKHISLDFWNTVGEPNKDYARERTALLARVFATTPELAKATYTRTKGSLDKLAEDHGISTPRAQCFERLAEAFESEPSMSLTELADEFDKLFAQYPPTIYPALRDLLLRYRNAGITLSIGSNTNFINGSEIREHVLRDIPFDFTIFSDEACVSKPNPAFFDEIAQKARACNPNVITNDDIAHVGDSVSCDGGGADRAGMRYVRVDNALHTATVLTSLGL